MSRSESSRSWLWPKEMLTKCTTPIRCWLPGNGPWPTECDSTHHRTSQNVRTLNIPEIRGRVMSNAFDEFSKSLSEETVPRRESLRRLGAILGGALIAPLVLGIEAVSAKDGEHP